jgi:hypothetical protein
MVTKYFFVKSILNHYGHMRFFALFFQFFFGIFKNQHNIFVLKIKILNIRLEKKNTRLLTYVGTLF